MTRPTMSIRNVKAAVVALTVLYAAVALAVLATASIPGDRSAPDRVVEAGSLEQGTLGR